MKMEIELTDEQAKKVETLKDNGIDVGEAIDILFEMKDAVSDSTNQFVDARLVEANSKKAQLEEEMKKVDEEISLFNKLKDTSLDPTQKLKIVEREYGRINKSYDVAVQESKHEFKWSKAIFKF